MLMSKRKERTMTRLLRRNGNSRGESGENLPRRHFAYAWRGGRRGATTTLVLVAVLVHALSWASSQAWAQGAATKTQTAVETPVAASDRLKTPAVESRALGEDLEILRIMVDRTLAELYRRVTRDATSPGWESSTSGWNNPSAERTLKTWRHVNTDPNLSFRDWLVTSHEPFARSLATYLAGYGIVVQAEASPLRRAPDKKVDALECPAMPISDWQRVRIEFRGGLNAESCKKCHESVSSRKGAATMSPGPPTRDELVQRVLGLLADNGHNISGLAPTERLTIAITIRADTAAGRTSVQSDRNAAGSGVTMLEIDNDGQSDLYIANKYNENRLFSNQGAGRFLDATRNPDVRLSELNFKNVDRSLAVNLAQAALGSGAANDIRQAQSNDELTGDLLLRQHQYQKAVEAYDKAVSKQAANYFGESLNVGIADTNRDGTPDQLVIKDEPSGKQWQIGLSLYRKMIQANVGAGNIDRATAMLATLQRAMKSPVTDSPSTGASSGKRELPARLVISVTKEQADLVHTGKLRRDEFKKQAIVVDIPATPPP
jgi:hypothetical protein